MSKHKFRVGDPVRVTIEGCWFDKTGVVAETRNEWKYINFVDLDDGGQVAFNDNELILADVVEANNAKFVAKVERERAEAVEHPAHYGGDTTYETIKVIEAWGLGFGIGNCVKYLSRAGKKGAAVEDLKKARFYLDREIARMESGS